MLSALLFTQGLLGFAAFATVVIKDRAENNGPARPALVASVASPDAQLR
jgi:hypothetical protein